MFKLPRVTYSLIFFFFYYTFTQVSVYMFNKRHLSFFFFYFFHLIIIYFLFPILLDEKKYILYDFILKLMFMKEKKYKKFDECVKKYTLRSKESLMQGEWSYKNFSCKMHSSWMWETTPQHPHYMSICISMNIYVFDSTYILNVYMKRKKKLEGTSYTWHQRRVVALTLPHTLFLGYTIS